MQGNMRSNMYGNQICSKFLLCFGLLEIIIAVIASAGLGMNVLATSNGVADIEMRNSSAMVGNFYAHVALKTDGYHFSGYSDSNSTTRSKYYSYESAYHKNCGKRPAIHSSSKNTSLSNHNCDLRFAIWQWSRAYTALGIIAVVIVFLTGVILLFIGCCGECLSLCCCCGKPSPEEQCCSCLFLCTAEWWLMVINFILFIMFSFSWGIIVGLKMNNHMTSILDSEANQALNIEQNSLYYDFYFHTVKVGRSLWPLAVASIMCLILTLYLLVMMCCACCRNCENCDDRMKCNCDKNYNNRNSTIERASDQVQV
jgi:hypothetical protein